MDYFEKKQWIRIGVCAVLVIALVLALTGVFSGNGPLTYDPAAKNVPAGATTAEATETGFGGDVTVSLSVVDNKIQTLTIDTPDETEGLGKRASEAEFTDQFIGKDGLFAFGEDGIEALSGATVTSNAALKAINRAYTIAVTGEEPEEKPEEADSGNAGGNDVLSAIALSMGNEKDNSYVTDYLKQDPYLVDIYEGYGFAKDYGSARGHAYTLEDVQRTQRPHAKANCLTCKTPDMHKLVAEQGVSVYSMPFDEMMAQTTNTVSCYTCHGADDGNNGQLVVTHQYVNEALGENVSEIKAASLSCGQCHIEYYFTPEDSEAMMPYHSVAEMTPAAILAYYDALGYSDWEQPGTGTKMLKAQHPELETYLYGKHASMLSCADCHMPVKTTENGATYHDHHVVSPLNSEILLNKCAECHGSGEAITARVREIQAKVTGRETQVGNRLAAFKNTFTAAVEAGKLNDEQLAALHKLHREAQWYFDFCYVENSEGAHNSSLAMECLETADTKLTEAFGILAEAGVEVGPEAISTGEKGEEETPAVSDGSVTEQGFGGDVTVHVVKGEDGTISSLTIDTPNETDGLGKRASDAAFTDQFIGKTGPFTFGEDGIEALSGATVTSNAALKAINKAVTGEKAGEQPGEATTETPAPEATETPAEQKEEKAGTDGLSYATYRSVKQNDFSTVTVIASTKNGELTDVKILSEGEDGKDLLTDAIKADWAKAILESGSASPDAITGASLKFSAASVQEAMTEILDQIRGTGAPAEDKTEAAETPAPEATEIPAEKTEEKSGTDGLAYATYRSVKQNDFSIITVIASTKNGELTDVKILSEGEDGKDLLTDEIKENWAKAILESGSASPDAITGASLKFSAASVQEAMTEILDQIKGKSAEAPAEEKPEVTEETKAEEPTETPVPEATEEPAPEATEEPVPEVTEEPAKPAPAFAGYRAEAKNDFSTVTVIAFAQNGKLTNVKILSEGEEGKDLLTDAIKADWAKAILESGSAAPDAITGASLKFSAASVQEAMTEILDRMNGKGKGTQAEEKPEATEETKAEEPTETPAPEATEEPAPEVTEEPAPEVTEEPAPETTEEPKASEEEPAKPAPAFAGYRAEAQNDFSTITVIVSAQNGKLTNVKILSEGEEGKDLLTDAIKADWAKAILESGSASPDAITGASLKFSAASVQEATAEILEKIAGK